MEKLFEMFAHAGEQLFLVGGAVRDAALGVASQDLDFATSARPKETIQILKANKLPAYEIGVEFGTVQTVLNGEKVEITTFRCEESYTKGSRKPGVTFGDTIEEDLVRRDFTFNAMAMAADGTIVDPFGGKSDLRKGVICTPSDPEETFRADPLRMLRAARFAARGFGTLENRTAFAMQQCCAKVNSLSGERVFEEITKLLLSPKPELGFEVLAETGVLKELFPNLWWLWMDEGPVGDYHHLSVWRHTMAVVNASSLTPEVRWAALFHDVGKPDCRTVDKRVHFIGHEKRGAEIWENVATSRVIVVPNDFRDTVRQLIAEHLAFNNKRSLKGARRLIHRMGDNLDNLIALAKADNAGHHPKHQPRLETELAECLAVIHEAQQAPTPVIGIKFPRGTGDKVAKALGIKPGPELGKVMKRLNQMLIDGDLTPESDVVAAALTLKE